MSATISLRPMRPTDASRLERWRSEPSVRRFQPLASLSQRQLRAEISARRHRDLYEDRGGRFDWIIERDDEAVGWITLVVHNWEHGLGECGYALSTRYQGEGIMPRALALFLDDLFAQTSLYRVEARCAVENAPSRRVLRRLGFTEEGLLRGYFLLHGERVDNVLYAILAEDWRKKVGG